MGDGDIAHGAKELTWSLRFDRERKEKNNPDIYAPIEKSNKSFLQAVVISCKTPFSTSSPRYLVADSIYGPVLMTLR